MEWIAGIQTSVLLLLGLGMLYGRHWLKANIEHSLRHKFDEKIESVRTEFHKSKELFSSELRSKETEISTLRDTILSGRANRQALLDKRRIDAVERVWGAFITLTPYKNVSAMMARIKLDVASKEAPRDPKVQQIFKIIGDMAAMPKASDYPVDNEKPFISPLAWAYFSAYRMVVTYYYATAKLLETGFKNSIELLNQQHIQDLLKAALPHQSKFIEEHKSACYHYLLDELENNLLDELKKILEGKATDEASVVQAKAIMEQVKKVDEDERTKNTPEKK